MYDPEAKALIRGSRRLFSKNSSSHLRLRPVREVARVRQHRIRPAARRPRQILRTKALINRSICSRLQLKLAKVVAEVVRGQAVVLPGVLEPVPVLGEVAAEDLAILTFSGIILNSSNFVRWSSNSHICSNRSCNKSAPAILSSLS